jgi:uncharacterized glyoxalase superfamily protein PhnB
MSQDISRPTFVSRIAYQDIGSAAEWLEKAFGFKTMMTAKVGDQVVHAEMSFGNGTFHLGSEWENIKCPNSIGGANTQTITVELEHGIEEHCAHARAAGGKIIQEPQDQFHGERTYRVVDPQGHVWTFSQKCGNPTIEEMEKAVPGMKIWKR